MPRPRSLDLGRTLRLGKQTGREKNKAMRKLKTQMKRLREEMKEIREEQAAIKEGQVRAKFEAIEREGEILQRETIQIIQQSQNTQLRLTIMFKILKARERGDFIMASELTRLLGKLSASDIVRNERSSVGSNAPTQQSSV